MEFELVEVNSTLKLLQDSSIVLSGARSRHAEATRLVLLLATILRAALDVQVTSGAVLVPQE